MTTITLAIIAGGKSTRMGTDKAFVRLAGKPMIEHLLERTANLPISHRLIVTNTPQQYAHLGLPMHTDVLPDCGSLGGIYTAIHHSTTDYTLCLACDMPLVNARLLAYLIELADEELNRQDAKSAKFDVIVPRVEGYPEGLHALYSRACLTPIGEQLQAGRLKVIGFYPAVQVRYVDEAEWGALDPDGLSFRNINTPQELLESESLLTSLGTTLIPPR